MSDEEVGKYLPMCRDLARPFVGRSDAELDDLVQEGMISCWQQLQQGFVPNRVIVRGRMQNWVRFLRKLQKNDSAAYELHSL